MGENLVQVDVSIDEKCHEEGAKLILQVIRPQWKPDNVKFKVFTEGITNKLFRCHEASDTKIHDGIVFRIYGANTEILIDREVEMRNMKVLHILGSGSQLYAKFKNGIAYSFIRGECLDEKTVRDPVIADLIAKEMARLHSVDATQLKRDHGIEIDTSPFFFPKMKKWIADTPDTFDDPKQNKRYMNEYPSKAKLLEELALLEKNLVPLNAPSVFTHNDLLLKNIVYNEEEGKVNFIDYEYGAYNYLPFDIGDHFAEYAGVDNLDFSRYPDRPYQLTWLRHYLEYKAEFEGKAKSSVTDQNVEIFYVQVNKFALAAHFFWGVWAVIQAKYSLIDFDYLDYGILKMNEYFARKDQFLAL